MSIGSILLVTCLAVFQVSDSKEPESKPERTIEHALFSTHSLLLGMTPTQVVERLGQRKKTSAATDSYWGKIPVQSVQYDGLLIQYYSSSPHGSATSQRVVRIVINNSKWGTKCGVKVGSSESQVLKTIGQPSTTMNSERGYFYNYIAYPGESCVDIFFKNGLVSRIELIQDPLSP